MSRIFAAFLGLLLAVSTAWPDRGAADVHVTAEGALIEDIAGGRSRLTLALTDRVPHRVYTLTNPPRLVIDLKGTRFEDLDRPGKTLRSARVADVRFGPLVPGWSRLVADLTEPMVPRRVAMTSGAKGGVKLSLDLHPVAPDVFRAAAGAPPGGPDLQMLPVPRPPRGADVFTVILDPGHGGIDPGAERGTLVEKDLVLDMAQRVATALRARGAEVALTRDRDVFVSLEARTALAQRQGGSVFVSIHADALSDGGAAGATLYTLSDRASDKASAELAARHNRADLLAGVDLTGSDDGVTRLLLDLARRETRPRSRALAEAIAQGMAAAGGPMNRKPLREAGFSVLKSADIPSVLVEIGFLSSARDARNLADPVWRALQADALAAAILAWREADAERRHLVRK